MNDVDSGQRLYLVQVDGKCFESRLELRLGALADFSPGDRPANVQIPLIEGLVAPAMNIDLNLLCKFPAQIVDMNSSPAVHPRRVFARKQAYSQ